MKHEQENTATGPPTRPKVAFKSVERPTTGGKSTLNGKMSSEMQKLKKEVKKEEEETIERETGKMSTNMSKVKKEVEDEGEEVDMSSLAKMQEEEADGIVPEFISHDEFKKNKEKKTNKGQKEAGVKKTTKTTQALNAIITRYEWGTRENWDLFDTIVRIGKPTEGSYNKWKSDFKRIHNNQGWDYAEYTANEFQKKQKEEEREKKKDEEREKKKKEDQKKKEKKKDDQ